MPFKMVFSMEAQKSVSLTRSIIRPNKAIAALEYERT